MHPARASFPSLLPFFLAGVAVLLSCCRDSSESGSADADAAPGPFAITATVGMIADIAKNVAGDRADVTGIIGEGVDPHLYKATSADIKKLQSADVVFYNGLLLEGKMSDILVRVARTGKPIYAVTGAIPEESDYVIETEEKHKDPHVWMDVSGWIRAVEVVADALAKYDPQHAAQYHENAAAYLVKLEELDAYAKKALGSIPESKRVLVTAHDAFNYMARAYGLQVRGIQGISTESEAGIKDIENLVDFLVDHEIPAVFVETSVSDKNVRALIEGANAKGHHVAIGGSLFSDAMGRAGTYEGTYIGMIDHNVTTIARALGGEAPEKGFQGKLSR